MIIGRWENGEQISENLWIFCDNILFFFAKKYFDIPHAIGALDRTFVEPNTPGLSRRGRLLGAVAHWQLRLFFFAKTGHPSAFVKVSAFFLQA